ncbi:MAG: PAS domain-containing sensor histidine kinase, partial [Rhizomicrobium sp.]
FLSLYLRQQDKTSKKDTHPMESDALARALIATAVDGIIVTDAKGVVQVYNAACEKLFGYRPDEVVGQNVKMLMPDPYRSEHDGYLENYRLTGEKQIIGIGREVVGRRKDLTTFPMYLSVGEGRIHDKQIFVGIIHDLTDQKSSQDAIREREARLRSILDTVPDAIITIDEVGIIESFSRAASRLFGYEPSEVVGKNVKMLMPPPYREQHDGFLEHYRRTGERRIIGKGRIVVGLRHDGSTFPMELAVGEVHGGVRRLFTGFVRDITERQDTEHRLQELQSELLHVSRLSAMGQMTAAIAHELNQPLTAITNYVKAARRTLDSRNTDPDAVIRAQDMIDKAAVQTLRAGGIIRNLRDFVEKRESNRTPENLSKVIQEALALAFVGAADKNIKLKLNLDTSLPPVLIDKIQIQQVLINLIRNSIEAMLTAKTRELLLATGHGDPGFANVTVRDSGPGLPQHISSRLFQPFQTTKDKGMGIGLTICQSIVDAHGGRIWLLQDMPTGAGFRFRLPLSGNLDAAA